MINLKLSIIRRAAELSYKTAEGGIATLEEYQQEYTEQFEEGSYNQYLRVFLGCMVEQGNKEAISVMKDIIRYNLARG